MSETKFERFVLLIVGLHPSVHDGVVNRTAKIYTVGGKIDSQFPIKVKNCNTYYVYHLPPTSSCPVAYCFGK